MQDQLGLMVVTFGLFFALFGIAHVIAETALTRRVIKMYTRFNELNGCECTYTVREITLTYTFYEIWLIADWENGLGAYHYLGKKFFVVFHDKGQCSLDMPWVLSRTEMRDFHVLEFDSVDTMSAYLNMTGV